MDGAAATPRRHRSIPRRRLLALVGGGALALPLLAACGGAASGQVAGGSASVSAVATSAAPSMTQAATGTTSATGSTSSRAATASGSAPASQAIGGATKLVFGSWVDSEQDRALYQGMVDTFNTQHPGIAVEFQPTAGGTGAFLEKFSSLLAAGTPPDVFNMYYPWIENFGGEHVFADLDPLIKADRVDLTDFFPNALNAFKYDGKQIALPHYAGPSVCFLNKSVFDKAGVPLPTPDWTWDDLVATAQKLTKPGGGQWGLAQLSTDLNWINAFIWENGGDEFSQDLRSSRLTEDAAVAAFTFATDLITKQRVSPTPADMKGKATNDMFHAGQLAMVINTCRCNVPVYQTWQDAQLTSVTLPKGKAGLISRDGPNAIGVSAASKQQQAGWQVANYFASPEGQTNFLATHRSVPTRKSFLDSKAFSSSLLPWESLEVYKSGMESERPGQYPKNWVQINKAVGAAMDKVKAGQAGASAALQEVNPQVQGLLNG